jgi:hypothetical protein
MRERIKLYGYDIDAHQAEIVRVKNNEIDQKHVNLIENKEVQEIDDEPEP